jgi:hypothetical protein
VVRVRVSPDDGPEMSGAGVLSVRDDAHGAFAFALDEQPLVTVHANGVRGGWLTVDDADDRSLSVDFTAGRLHVADGLGSSTALHQTRPHASCRVARQGVRGWPEVLHDIAAVGSRPRERPDRPVFVVDRDAPGRRLCEGDDPTEVSLFVGNSERLRLSTATFRGAWLSDRDDNSYLDIDASGGDPDRHRLLRHRIQVSSVWGVH